MNVSPPGRSTPTPADEVLKLSRSVLRSLPAKVDLRRRAPARLWPVWDQGTDLSCTAHAVAGLVLFHRIRIKARPLFQPSRMFIFHCEQSAIQAGGGGEATVQNAMDVIRLKGKCADVWTPGVPTNAVWKYTESYAATPPKSCFDFAARYKNCFAKYYLCQDLDHLRGCLAEGNPFAVMISVCAHGVGDAGSASTPPSDGVPVTPKNGDIAMPTETWIRRCGQGRALCNHALLVVGYDDARRRFIIRNSFGAAWGTNGYGTIPYEYLLNHTLADQGWMLHPLPEPTASRPAPKRSRARRHVTSTTDPPPPADPAQRAVRRQ